MFSYPEVRLAAAITAFREALRWIGEEGQRSEFGNLRPFIGLIGFVGVRQYVELEQKHGR